MLPRLLAVAVLALLLVPSAAAFSATTGNVVISYDDSTAPIMLATGQLDAGGQLRGGLLAGALTDSRVGPAPSLAIAESHNGTPSLVNVSRGTLVVHEGNLVFKIDDQTATLHATSTYAFGLALAQSPFDSSKARTPGLVMAGPRIDATLHWAGGQLDIVPLAATVSVLDASGKPVPGWDHRAVNPETSVRAAQQDQANGDVTVFVANGAFDATLHAQALAAGIAKSGSGMKLGVTQSSDDEFSQAASAVGNVTQLVSGAGDSTGSGGSASGSSGGSGGGGGAAGGFDQQASGAIEQLSALSGIFNGAVLILKAPANQTGDAQGQATDAGPRDARLGDRALDIGPFALLRSQDLALAWGDGTVGVQGASKATVTQSGFAVDPPLVIGYVPLLSALLWLVALGSIVWFFVKRPPASKGKWSIRGVSWLAYLVVLLVVFWFWDRSFADTFGTSVLSQLAKGNVNYTQLGLVFGIEMLPWSLAALLFALPVRIALGVALRYRGEGSSYKGVAKAGGLVALAVLGPIYALWIVNVLIAGIVAFAPKLFGNGG